ncbi:hypothetical protein A3C37_04605 [Candidatus Peribacteria bacterium RIFCSPHIGHO2_02_FULL_53_20]|nr:MAG: hypothetical protein A2881_01600 [Candidatus Peribacteria bacterium RIFCSPHIGHO2_01_FULL_55_13]OGJ62771.1 MAG: hypothetical protein A3C37_04605 [Candidatus Peribacteria bacterium RIFCSPHIGHO2_02_FULL_53_20]OGJ66196.1 MAG: hypothetical protein A3B61_02680 [Candidatus Peribacteria bacterium RIFCSPLOWO2_01_FULL_53_10]
MSLRSSLGSLWSKVRVRGSPFRVIRCYAMRIAHPLAYCKRRRIAKRKIAELTPEQQTRLPGLIQDGCGPAGPDQNSAMLQELCAELRRRAQEVEIDMQQRPGKNFWERLQTPEDLRSDSLFIRFAMQPAVLKMMCGYFGELPYLSRISVYRSHGTNNASWQDSQLWHQDYDDRKMLKLFVYCTDVRDEQDGEFTYIPKTISQRIKNTFFPGRISDEEMTRQGGTQHVRKIRGPAGSTFYIDTRGCYHLGSRMGMGHTRIAFVASFITHASPQPFFNDITIVHPLTDVEKMVLRCP